MLKSCLCPKITFMSLPEGSTLYKVYKHDPFPLIGGIPSLLSQIRSVLTVLYFIIYINLILILKSLYFCSLVISSQSCHVSFLVPSIFKFCFFFGVPGSCRSLGAFVALKLPVFSIYLCLKISSSNLFLLTFLKKAVASLIVASYCAHFQTF